MLVRVGLLVPFHLGSQLHHICCKILVGKGIDRHGNQTRVGLHRNRGAERGMGRLKVSAQSGGRTLRR